MREIRIQRKITPRDEESVERFLKDVSKIPLLITDEEVRLATLSVQGDMAARGKLVESNLRFVVSIAKQYQNQGLSLSDLIQEGNAGLVKASQKFDPTRGFKFVSYAVWWIRQSILAALSEHSLVWLPSNLLLDISKVRKAVDLFQSKMDREPSVEELSGLVKMKELSIIKAFREMKVSRHISLDAPVGGLDEGDPLSLYSMIPEQSAGSTDLLLTDESMRIDFERVLAYLSERQRTVIQMRLGIGYSPMEFETIACTILPEKRLSTVCVRTIYNNGIDRLKNSKDARRVLKKYLG